MPQTSINNPLNPSGVGLVKFLCESQSRLYPHMRAKFGRGPTVVSKKGSLKLISRLFVWVIYWNFIQDLKPFEELHCKLAFYTAVLRSLGVEKVLYRCMLQNVWISSSAQLWCGDGHFRYVAPLINSISFRGSCNSWLMPARYIVL